MRHRSKPGRRPSRGPLIFNTMTNTTQVSNLGAADTRSPTDYALEHAEYLARGAEQLLSSINALAMLRDQVDQDSDNVLGDHGDLLSEAETHLSEAAKGLQSDIYEFRKRRDRAQAPAPAALAKGAANPTNLSLTLGATVPEALTAALQVFGYRIDGDELTLARRVHFLCLENRDLINLQKAVAKKKEELGAPSFANGTAGVPASTGLNDEQLANVKRLLANEFGHGPVMDQLNPLQWGRVIRVVWSAGAKSASPAPVPVESASSGEVPIAPPYCPITGSKFWGNVEHPQLGKVALYGGPFDSFTIPKVEIDGELRSERYDQDAGRWVEGGQPVGWCYSDQQGEGEPLTPMAAADPADTMPAPQEAP